MASEEWGILNNPNALIEPGHNLLFGCWIACVLVAAIAVRLLDSVLKASLRARWPQEHFMAEPLKLFFSVLQSIGATLVWVPVAGSSVMAIQRARYSCPSVKGKEYPVLPIDVFSILLPIHSE